MGGDKWFGVPNYAEYLQVYYNKDLFKKYDVEIPKTFDELTAAMDKFVAKDVTPLTNAGAEYMAHQFVYQLALDKADQNWWTPSSATPARSTSTTPPGRTGRRPLPTG